MYFKLSLRNVRKSLSDYTLYFLTLTFGVCMFYVFNSLEAQEVMLSISLSMLEIMHTITKLMNGISIFVSLILGFLIIYANNFLIRRRKREFGLYMTLGMSKHNISRILLCETLIIGVLSLAAGLLMGLFLSQGLSVITARLFEIDMSGYRFIFSLQAFWKTILYFGLIFLIAVSAGTLSISRHSLIELINASKHNETPAVKKPAMTLTLFLLSVLCIGIAYAMVLKYGIATFDRKIVIEGILGSIGTFLFFASLSGAMLGLVQKKPSFYYKGLNLFIMRQINSRINTTYLSMSFICLMLFVTIGIFSTGMGMTGVLNRGYSGVIPFDVSLEVPGADDPWALLAQSGVDLQDYADDFHRFHFYRYDLQALTQGTILKEVADLLPEENAQDIVDRLFPQALDVVALSDYNALMQLRDKQPLALGGSEVALMSQFLWVDADFQSIIEEYVGTDGRLSLGGTPYRVQTEILSEGIVNDSDHLMTLIVPDAVIADCTAVTGALCFNCRGNSAAMQDALTVQLDALIGEGRLPFKEGCVTRNMVQAVMGGSKAIIAFFAIYVGIVFLITSAAVLALQQLSEAADNRQRYEILKKIGADDALIHRTLFKQIAIYFLLPLSLACVHALVGLKVANDVVREVGSLNALQNTLATALLILLVYGAYFLATYYGSKQIMLKNGQRHE